MTKKPPTQSHTLKKKAMLEALVSCLGVVSPAAKKAGIDRRTHYEWMNIDPDYKKAVDDIKEVAIDFVEYETLKATTHSPADRKFYLSTQARHRGYGDKTELEMTGKDGGPLVIRWEK